MRPRLYFAASLRIWCFINVLNEINGCIQSASLFKQNTASTIAFHVRQRLFRASAMLGLVAVAELDCVRYAVPNVTVVVTIFTLIQKIWLKCYIREISIDHILGYSQCQCITKLFCVLKMVFFSKGYKAGKVRNSKVTQVNYLRECQQWISSKADQLLDTINM